MAALADVENKLNEVFVAKTPALSENAKRWIVEYLPWINVIFGLFTLWAVYALWRWTRVTSELVEYANNFTAIYGGTPMPTHRWTFVIWLSLATLLAQAIVYILAFPALMARKKSGWDLLFYAALLNLAYGLVVMFSEYGDLSSLVASLISTAVGLYFLFQIRARYLGMRVAHTKSKKA